MNYELTEKHLELLELIAKANPILLRISELSKELNELRSDA